MGRGRNGQIDQAGQDSFLDVVTNIVAVLIILVLVVSARARHAPVTLAVAPSVDPKVEKQLAEDRATEASLNRAIWEEAARVRNLELAHQASDLRRQQLDLAVVSIQRELDRRRGELDLQARSEYDRRRQQAEADARLEELRRRREQLAQTVVKPTVIEHRPTPLSRVVDGPEIHVQLKGNRIAVVPLEELATEALDGAKRQFSRPQETADWVSGETSAINNFRVRYEAKLYRVIDRQTDRERMGTVLRIERIEVTPTVASPGETFDMALSPGSDFDRALAASDPRRTTVTVWVYPDSFDAFRRMKQWLTERRFATAARFLPDGVPISGSPSGSRSAAQ